MTRQLMASLVVLCPLSFHCHKGPRPDERPNILNQLMNLAEDEKFKAITEELSRQLNEELTRTADPRIQGRHEEVFYIPRYKNLERRETR